MNQDNVKSNKSISINESEGDKKSSDISKQHQPVKKMIKKTVEKFFKKSSNH